MSYIINKTDGGILTTILDGTTSTSTGLTLIGRNYTSYGDAQNENFVKLLENFADIIPPTESSLALTPLTGTLWYDTGNKLLKVYNGTNFVPVSQQYSSSTIPTATNAGDQWWDTTNKQLFIWNGSEWLLIGPQHTIGQGLSGTVVEIVTDTAFVDHVVVKTYTNNNLISVTSYDQTFTPSPTISGFTTISQGINLAGNVILNGKSNNSVRLGGLYANAFARIDQPSAFTGDVSVSGNLQLTNSNISFANNNLVLQNKTYQGNVDVYLNTTASGNIRVLNISGDTGLVTVTGDPTLPKQVATKNYVDAQITSVAQNIQNETNQLTVDIDALRNDYFANIEVVVLNNNANLSAVQSSTNSNVNALATSTTARFTATNVTLASQANSISTISNTLPLLATINSPQFTGIPTAPQVPKYTTYVTNLGLLDSSLILNRAVTVNAGDYIEERSAETDVVIANLQSLVTTSSSNIRVNTITGTVTNDPTSQVFINGVRQSAVHTVSLTKFGPLPKYLGLGDASGSIATTAYVDVTANILYGDYDTRDRAEQAARATAISNAVAPLSPINSPVFTGVPCAPTPVRTTNTTQIATTAYVTDKIEAQRFRYTVDTNPPTGGVDGDFWFQLGS